MSTRLSRASASDFADWIASRIGLSLSVERWDELSGKIASAARKLGFDDDERFVRWVVSTNGEPGLLESVASVLTVGETYFYRESNGLEAIERHVFPRIARERAEGRQLRIWSAGCATGEEPYTLAMMVSEQAAFRDWDVTIVGSDISEPSLARAEAGTYTEWSFRGVPQRIRSKYFRKTGRSSYEILDSIKGMVVFEHLNLVGDEYPTLTTNTNAMDLILCRNVLMYFRPTVIEMVVGKLTRSLVEGGWLVVSPVEGPLVADPALAAVSHPGGVLYCKRAAADRAAPARPRTAGPLPKARPAGRPAAARRSAAAAPAEPDPRADELAARAHADAGRLADAEEYCRLAIRRDKLSATLRCLLATILIERRQLERAAASLRQAIYLDPEFILPHFALGNLSLRQDNRRDARRHFGNALQLLDRCDAQTAVPQADGLSAGRLSQIIRSLLLERARA